MTTPEPAPSSPVRPGRLVVVLASVLASGTFLQFAAGAMAPLYAPDLRLAPSDVGLVFTTLLVVALVASPPAGRLVDAVGPRPCLVAAPLLAGTGMVLAAQAGDLTLLLAATVPGGLGMSLVNPAVNSAAAGLAGPATGLVVGLAQVGVQLGAVAAGLLAVTGGTALPWRWTLAGAGAACVLAALASWRLPPVAHPGRRGRARPVAAPASERRAVLRLAGYALTMGTGSAVVFAYLPLAAVHADLVGPGAAGWTAVTYGGVAVLCRLLLPRLLRTVGDGVLVGLALLAAASVALVALAPQAPALLWVGAALFGATGTTWPAVAMLALVLAAPGERAGRQSGTVTAGFYAGLAVGPVLAALALAGPSATSGDGASAGYVGAWVVAVVAYLVAAAGVVLTRAGARGGAPADGALSARTTPGGPRRPSDELPPRHPPAP
ncbi:MFS transporter [Thalassiella azotivora]